MRRIVFRLALTFVVLLTLTLPSQAAQNMTNMSVNFGAPGCSGDITMKIQVPGAPLTVTAQISVPPDTALTKAQKLATAVCNACGGINFFPAGATCATLTTAPPSGFSCPVGLLSYSVVLTGASLNINAGTLPTLNAVLCKESTCETETMIASSPANMNIFTAQRLSQTVTEGTLAIGMNEVTNQQVTVQTGGKREWEIMNEAATKLNALNIGITAATATIGNRRDFLTPNNPRQITSWGSEHHSPSRTALVILNTAGNVNLTEFKFTPPGAGWAVTGEASPELAPSTTGTPALSTWGISAFVGLVLLAGAWMLRRGLAH